MKKLLPFFFALAGLAAQAQNYTALNGPFTGSPSKIIEAGGAMLGIAYSTGVLKSTNGGITWTQSNTGLTNLYLNDITKDALSGKLYVVVHNQLFTSADNGATWSLTANSGFTSARFIRKATSFLYIVGGNNAVYRSSNDGVSWAQVNSFTGYPVDFDLNTSGFLYISTNEGISRSTNSGLSFDVLDAGEGLTETNVNSVITNGAIIYAATYTGPFKSTNNGDTWVSIKTNITDCCFDNAMMEKDPSGNIYIFSNSKIYKTINAGTSWTNFNSPVQTNLYGNLVGPYFESSSTFYVGINSLTLYKTIDSGTSWIPLFSNGITTSTVSDLVMTDNGRLLYSNNSPYGFFLSIDDGATWDFLSTGVTARAIRGFKKIGSTIYGYGSGIIKSTNNGSVWTEQTSSSYFDNLINEDATKFFSINLVWNGTANVWNLKKSNDAGVNWADQAITGMPSPDCFGILYPQNQEVFFYGSNIYVRIYDYCTGNSSVYKIDRTTAIASEITSVPSTNSINSMDVFNGKVYVFTNNGRLHISDDGGVNWITKTTTTSNGRIKIIDANTFYILNNSIFLSTDGGTNWVNTGSPGGTNKQYSRILVSSANYSYVAQDYGLTYRSVAPVIPPVAPSALSSFGHDRNSVGLIWTDNSNNEDKFVIEASEGDNLHYDSAGQATRPNSWTRAQGFTIISSIKGVGLKSNTTYFFRVRASSAGGKSAPSNEISVTTLVDCSTTSSLPQNRSWTAATLNTSGVGIKTALNQTLTGSNGNYSVSNLDLGAGMGLSPTPPTPWGGGFEENCGSVFLSNTTQYISNGNGTWDPATNKVTMKWMTHPQYPLRTETTVYTLNASDPVPAVPTNFAGTVFTQGAILLNWSSGSFTVQFEVERSTTSGSGFVKVADVNFPTISYKDLDPALVTGTIYYYRIRAKNATGSSAYTAQVSVIPRNNYLYVPMNTLPSKTFSRTGGGGSWGDVDDDGIIDLILPVVSDSTGVNELPPQVFKGIGNGQFSKLIIPELQNEVAGSRNINIIDVNNDGRNDIYVSRSNTYDVLLIKNPDGSYYKTQITDISVVAKGIAGSSWVDYDGDNDLDLLITSRASTLTPEVFLYNNDGTGVLTRVTTGELVTDISYTGDAEWADYDNDGDQDVLVINQSGVPCRLYKNNGDGTFTRVLSSAFELSGIQGRSASWGDYDNDGDLDVFLTDFGAPYGKLFKNQGDGTFVDSGKVFTEDAGSEGFTAGSAWADLDNDQDLDLIISGSTAAIFYNDGVGNFTKYAAPELFNAINLNKFYGVAMHDADGDGFLDFHTGGFSNPDIPNIIFRNSTIPSANQKWIKIKLVGTVSNRSAIGARVYVNTGAITQMRELQSHTGHTTQSSPTQHFGVGSNSIINSITIDWPSGLSQTYNNIASNQTLTIIEDGTGPAVTLLLPADNALDASVNTKIEITFDELPIAVANKKIEVFVSGTSLAVFSVNTTTGTVTGNKVSFTLATNLIAANSYTVQVEPGAFKDQFNNLTEAITWSFETKDQTPPVITFTPIPTIEKGFNSTKFSVTIVDNSGMVTSAQLFHRKISGSTFSTIDGVFNPTDVKWEFTVPETFFDESGMEYNFIAKDPSNNEGRLPTGTVNFYTHLIYKASGNVMPQNRLGFGGTTAAWKIFSIPFELGSSNAVSTVFDELNDLDLKKDWRMVTLKDNTTWDEYPTSFSTLTRGKGYFINIKNPVTIGLPELSAPTNHRGNLFQISLKAGWNQIGNPYLSSINWSDVVALNNLTGTAQQLKTYTSGNYNNGTSLQPFEGGFVLAESAATISIPFAGQTSTGGRTGEIPFEEDEWVLPITLSQGELTNEFGGIGMHRQAVDSYDQFDDINAPRFLDFIEMNFDHPEYFVKKFARDVVPLQQEYRWSFVLNGNVDSEATLNWDNSVIKNISQDLYLVDESKQVIVDMREKKFYSINPQKSTTFKIYFGNNLKNKIKPEGTLLGDAFPNPSNGDVTIPFTVSGTKTTYQVNLDVYDMTGKKISTLVNDVLAPGFYSVLWKSSETTNSNGMYTYRLRVLSENQNEVQSGKVILNK